MKKPQNGQIETNDIETNCPYCVNPHELPPVTREIADRDIRCGNPECTCTTIEIAPECHPDAGTRIFYCHVHGTLAAFCGKCRRLQSAFLISPMKAWVDYMLQRVQ